MSESKRTTRRHLTVVPVIGRASSNQPVDDEKVARLRERIQRGTYRIDAVAIAQRMLAAGALDEDAPPWSGVLRG